MYELASVRFPLNEHVCVCVTDWVMLIRSETCICCGTGATDLPVDKIGPKTVLSFVVLQFQRRPWSWYWHSAMPMPTPRATLAMWSGYSWHMRRCPALSPSSWTHTGPVLPPRTIISGPRHSSELCIARLLKNSRQLARWSENHSLPVLSILLLILIINIRITQSRSSCRLRSSYRNRLVVPYVKLSIGSRSFSVSGPTVWTLYLITVPYLEIPPFSLMFSNVI